MVYVALAVMTGLAMGFVLWPLAFRAREAGEDGREAAFYRGQLDEIARDVERGQLPEAEAASARAEAARRLLAASDGRRPRRFRERSAAGAARRWRSSSSCRRWRSASTPRSARRTLPDEPLSARKIDLKAPARWRRRSPRSRRI